jgi:hypothetical protein
MNAVPEFSGTVMPAAAGTFIERTSVLRLHDVQSERDRRTRRRPGSVSYAHLFGFTSAIQVCQRLGDWFHLNFACKPSLCQLTSPRADGAFLLGGGRVGLIEHC